MNLFNTILHNVVLASFSLLLYLFYVAYNNSIEKEERKIFFELALYSTFYLLTKFGTDKLIMINIPLVLAYSSKKKFESLLFTILIITTYNFTYHINILLLVIEYSLYYLIFLLIPKKNLTYLPVLTIKGIIYIALTGSFKIYYTSKKDILIWILIAILTTTIVNIIIKKGSEIMKYHMHYKELLKDSQVTSSLFKITHEIKNPLAVCLGYLGMIDLKDTKKCQEYIPIIKEEIDRSLLILQDFSNMGNIKLNIDIIDIGMLIEESIANLKPLLKANKITIDFKDLDNEIYIEGDYNRLTQVMMNLIKNSVEAMDNSGIIKIEVTASDKVYITITDNGKGIEPDIIDKIKEPFFTTKEKGTGIGVALTYEIIELHKGTVKYSSKVNEGTKVTITLPQYLIS